MPIPAEVLESAGKTLSEHWHSLAEGFQGSEAGKDLYNLLGNYPKVFADARQKGVEAAKAMPRHLQPTPHDIDSAAHNQARLAVLGQNDYRGVGLIKAVENDPQLKANPLAVHAEQQKLADHVHMFLRDTVETKKTSIDKTQPKWLQKKILAQSNVGPQSKFKVNVKNSKENQVLIDSGAIYKPPKPWERYVTKAVSVPMLWGIVIPHLGTVANYVRNTDLVDLAKGVTEATLNPSAVKQFNKDHGIFSSTLAEAYAIAYNGERGIIAGMTGSPTFGRIVAQMTHAPLFNSLRTWTLAIGAATGKLQLERYAKNLLANPADRRAIYQLRQMGVNPADVLAKKGLDPDMLRTGIYNYVDSRVFLDNSMNRAFAAQKDTFHRLAGMYHGYISRQGSFMLNALKEDIGNTLKPEGGIVNAAKTFGLMSIAFPTVGIGIKSLQMWGRGQFNTHPIQEEEDLYGAHGVKKAGEEWLEGMTHMAAFGVGNDYIRASARHMLLQSAAGPVGNEVANIITDTLGAFYHFNSDNPNESLKPIERDLLQDTIPGLGKILSHQMLPPKQKHSSAKLPKIKGLKGLPKLPKM